MHKKALIIAYYWPPAGGPGVQRWLKFVKYLPVFGVEPIVFVPENPSYPIVDSSLLEEVNSNLTVIKQPIKEPYRFAEMLSKKKSSTISKGIISEHKRQGIVEKAMLYIRGNFFIPDARVGWVKPSVTFLHEYIQNQKIETIVTTGPPHSLHLIGLQLKQKLNLKWIADFRDPWTTIGYQKELKLSDKAKTKHKKMETEVLTSADHIIVTSAVTKLEFEKLTKKPIKVITNGYDLVSNQQIELDAKFTLSHIGSLLSRRNPEILWQVLKELILENEDFKRNFQLNLIGNTSEEVLNSLREYNLTKYVNNVGYITYKQSVERQKKSQILLLIEIDSEETKCIIPGKLFDYLVSNRPIIALGPKDSDVQAILEKTEAGHYFNYQDKQHLKETLLSHFTAYQKKSLFSNVKNIEKYSRKELTKELANLI